MRKLKLLIYSILVLLLFFSFIVSAADVNKENQLQPTILNRYFENSILSQNMLVRIYTSNQQTTIPTGLEVVSSIPGEWVDAIVPLYGLPELEKNNLEYKIEIFDLDTYNDNVRRNYHTLAEMENIMYGLANDYPSITKLTVIGTTYQSRDILCLEISDNPGVDEGEPGVFFMGLHHAREWPSLEICLYIAENLTSYYGTDTDITNIVNNRRIWIVPCVNPDGYYYDHDQGHDWRKNRHYFPEHGTYGVDLNRNWGGSSNGDPLGSWGVVSGQTSHNPSNSLYCGPGQMSELEIQAIRDIYLQNDICASISWHTHGELVLWPWNYDGSIVTPDNAYLSSVGTQIAQKITKQSGSGTYTPEQGSGLYPTTGDTTDWAYGYSHYVQCRPHFSYTIEACNTFHPSSSYLQQVCEENFDGAFYLLQEATSINNVVPRVIPPEIDEMTTDDDGDYTVSWSGINIESNPLYYQLDELTGLNVVTDDAESGSGLWNLDGFSISTSRAHSQTHSFKCRSSNDDVSSMTSSYSLPVTDGMNLEFWCWYDIETDYDQAFVEISKEGRFYKVLDTFTGTSNGWELKQYNLAEYVGESIFLRFRYATDGNTLNEGFYVDDIYPVSEFSTVNTLSSNIATTYYDIVGNSEGIYYYRVKGFNSEHQWGDFGTLEDINVTLNQNTIVISNITADPQIQSIGSWVNISCSISSLYTLTNIRVIVTQPNDSIINQTMENIIGTELFYFNTTYNLEGTHSYYIWVEDSTGNTASSYNYQFYIGQDAIAINLSTGWNLITIPVENDWMASDLANNVTGCLSVNKWDAVNQSYRGYIVGIPAFDFPIVDGCGYFVEVDQPSVLYLTGTNVTTVNIPFKIAWNIIGWYDEYNTTASSLAENITGCLSVNKWDAVNQSYRGYIVGIPAFDFTISRGMGIFLEVSEESTWQGEG